MSMIKRASAGAVFFTLAFTAAFPQAGGPAAGAATPTFQVADIHPSPHTNTPNSRGGGLYGDRYRMRDVTLLDLIARAYDIEDDNVIGGPAWLDTDRFDIVASTPRTTSPEDLRLMLRALLADRFKLVVHPGTKDLPAFVLSEGKGKPKLKPSDGTGESGCGNHPQPPPTPDAADYNWISCHNLTSAQIADTLRRIAGDYLSTPVVDLTGLKGSWDFDIKWTRRGQIGGQGADGISIFDAVDKQLGLKLEAKTAPLPTIVVDSANEKPTPNAPGIDKALPPAPPAAFDVAVIKPSASDVGEPVLQFRGNQISITGATLQYIIVRAWGLNPNDPGAIAGAPKWLDQDKFDILGKVSPELVAAAPKDGPPIDRSSRGAPPIDRNDLLAMARTLITERFKMQSHMGEHLTDAYTLVAASPKLRKADPTMRTGCHEGPGPDGKDPRIADPINNRLVTCQNMTMAQFADELLTLAAGSIYYPVLDSTNLQGSYDFTLNFSMAGMKGGDRPPPPGSAAASDPSGAISLFDAINKQLGLKLVQQKRPEPALVIDHIEEKPTEN